MLVVGPGSVALARASIADGLAAVVGRADTEEVVGVVAETIEVVEELATLVVDLATSVVVAPLGASTAATGSESPSSA